MGIEELVFDSVYNLICITKIKRESRLLIEQTPHKGAS